MVTDDLEEGSCERVAACEWVRVGISVCVLVWECSWEQVVGCVCVQERQSVQFLWLGKCKVAISGWEKGVSPFEISSSISWLRQMMEKQFGWRAGKTNGRQKWLLLSELLPQRSKKAAAASQERFTACVWSDLLLLCGWVRWRHLLGSFRSRCLFPE